MADAALALFGSVGCGLERIPTPTPGPEPPRSPYPFEVLHRTYEGSVCMQHTTPFLALLNEGTGIRSIGEVLESVERDYLTAVDRGRYLIVLVGAGSRGSTRHGVRTRSVELTQDEIVVRAALLWPPPSEPVNPAVTCPRSWSAFRSQPPMRGRRHPSWSWATSVWPRSARTP